MEPIEIGLSPCPNDTFIFYAWQAGHIPNAPKAKLCFHDVEELNQLSSSARYPVTKLSTFHYGNISSEYLILPVGCALGFNCGPKIISKTPTSISEIKHKRIAIPGKHTTAHSLLCLMLDEPKEKVYCSYDEVEGLIESGRVDLGLIIHETRFTFEDNGFYEVVDLGEKWQTMTSLPIPLGIFAVRRDLSPDLLSSIQSAMQASLEYAWKHPQQTMDYLIKHSIEKDPDIIMKHVKLYVTDETASVSKKGQVAISTFLTLCERNKLFTEPLVEPYLLSDALCPSS